MPANQDVAGEDAFDDLDFPFFGDPLTVQVYEEASVDADHEVFRVFFVHI